MTTNVTVFTSASSSVLVPFSSAANAAVVQAALDANANALAKIGFYDYFSPPSVSGPVTLPTPSAPFGGVADTVGAALNFGILDPAYNMFVNAGNGLAVAIGSVTSTLVSGNAGQTIYVNQSTNGQAFVGGGNNVLSNAFSISKLTALVDSDPAAALGSSTLILDDRAGGAMNVKVGNGLLALLEGGGADSIVAQSGTVAILTHHDATAPGGTATIGTAGAGVQVWVGAQGGSTFINPGAGDTFVFQGVAGTENSATLFGGTKSIGGSTRTADAFTGRATVLGMNGYFEGGSAGGSILQSGTAAGAATLIAGGAGDVLIPQGIGDFVDLGAAAGVQANASSITVGGGVIFNFGAGSGNAVGGQAGHNTFNFTGAGNYTVLGFHDRTVPDTSPGFLAGSIYKNQAAGPGGAGTITINDFLPQQITGTGTATVAGAVFDQFDLNGHTVTSINVTDIGGGNFNNVAVLSDGTTINFNNTVGRVHQVGTFLQ